MKNALLLFVFLLLFHFCGNETFAQKKRKSSRSAPPTICTAGQPNDFKFSELHKMDANRPQLYDLGDGFQASSGCGSIVVTIPGEFTDSLSGGRARPLSLQLAAAIFVKANNTSDNSIEEAIENSYIDSERVRRAGDMTTIYLFRANNGRIARIFTYFNDFHGLTGVLEMAAANKPRTRK